MENKEKVFKERVCERVCGRGNLVGGVILYGGVGCRYLAVKLLSSATTPALPQFRRCVDKSSLAKCLEDFLYYCKFCLLLLRHSVGENFRRLGI